jgi:hypothetical protein
MNNTAIRTAWLLLLPAMSSAGVYIETVTRDIKSGTTSPAQKIHVQGDMARIETADGDVTIFKGDMLYSLDRESRSYRVMDQATMQQMASGINSAMQQMQAQMQARMAQMTPEQRAQMQQMMGAMGGADPNAKANVYEAVDTGRNENAAGRGCRVWNMKRNGVVEDEYCVVPFSSLPGKENVQALMRRMGELFQSLEQAMPNAASGGGMMRAYTRINGYPVRQRDIVAGKPAGTEELLKAWLEQPVPAAMFEIPAGYARKDMPTGMRARGGDAP